MNEKVEGAVHCEQVTSCISSGVSTDGEAVLLLFGTATGGRFSMVVPTVLLGSIRSVLSDAIKQALQRKKDPGQLILSAPKTFGVGHNDDQRGHICLVLDQHLDTEQCLVFRDEDALKLVSAIQNDILGRTPPAERSKLMTSAAPLPRKLILPGH